MNVKQSKLFEDIIISNFNNDDLKYFIEIHLENLFSENEFSRMYLKERFKYLLQYEDAVLISAKDTKGKMLGLVYGGPEGYKNNMNKYIMKKIALSLLKKPHLLCSGEFIYKYKSAFNRIAKKIILSKNAVLSNDLKTQCVPSSPILRLTGIAVLEEYSRLGIGKQLLSSYEKVAKDRNYKSIILETPRANIKAIRFYEKLGWRNYDNENGNLNKAYFYKSIIE